MEKSLDSSYHIAVVRSWIPRLLVCAFLRYIKRYNKNMSTFIVSLGYSLLLPLPSSFLPVMAITYDELRAEMKDWNLGEHPSVETNLKEWVQDQGGTSKTSPNPLTNALWHTFEKDFVALVKDGDEEAVVEDGYEPDLELEEMEPEEPTPSDLRSQLMDESLLQPVGTQNIGSLLQDSVRNIIRKISSMFLKLFQHPVLWRMLESFWALVRPWAQRVSQVFYAQEDIQDRAYASMPETTNALQLGRQMAVQSEERFQLSSFVTRWPLGAPWQGVLGGKTNVEENSESRRRIRRARVLYNTCMHISGRTLDVAWASVRFLVLALARSALSVLTPVLSLVFTSAQSFIDLVAELAVLLLKQSVRSTLETFIVNALTMERSHLQWLLSYLSWDHDKDAPSQVASRLALAAAGTRSPIDNQPRGHLVMMLRPTSDRDAFNVTGKYPWSLTHLPEALVRTFPLAKFTVLGVYDHTYYGPVFPILPKEQVGTDKAPDWYDARANLLFANSYVPGWTPGTSSDYTKWMNETIVIESGNTPTTLRNGVTNEVIVLPEVLVNKFPLDKYYIEPISDARYGTVYYVSSLEDEEAAIDNVPVYYDRVGEQVKRTTKPPQ